MEASHMKKIFEELSEECLKCSVCSKLFDNHEHIPRYYPCMHSTCEGCMSRQFIHMDTGDYFIRCPHCFRHYPASSPPDVTKFTINNTLLSVKEFISSREKEEFCEKCSDQLSEAVCTDCELSLCRSCTDSIHISNNSNHNVIFGTRRQDIPKNSCRVCLNQSNIYCSTCKRFFCQVCETIHHNDKSARTHEVIQFIKDEEEELLENRLWVMGFLSHGINGTSQNYRVFVVRVRSQSSTTATIKYEVFEECIPYRRHSLLAYDPETSSFGDVIQHSCAFLLMLLVLLGTYIESFPAYTLLPFDEVEPLNMKCRHRTKEELHQSKNVSKIESHRTLCTFYVFHYDLRNRNKTYFVLDIDIDIAKIRHRSSIGKLFTIKLFHFNETYNTYHMQRSKYWSVSWCRSPKDELAMCLDVNDYRKETIVEQNTIGRMGENKRVSFLFVVDNNREVMEIFSTEVLLKDDISLERYYEEQILSVWISLTDPKNDKHLSARIRSGGNITIGDLPNPSIVTHYETVRGVITYPFRYLVNLYTMFLVGSKDK